MFPAFQQFYLHNRQQHLFKAFRPPVFGPHMGPNTMNGMGSIPAQTLPPQNSMQTSMNSMNQPPPYLEYRIMEMNQRLNAFFVNRMNLNENDQMQWWFAFAQEFFDDNGFLTVTTLDRNPESKYTIGRLLIPRFFRAIHEYGVCDLQFVLQNSVEMFGTNSNFFVTALNSEVGEMIVRLERPMRAEIKTSARYFIEFAPYDEIFGYRIRGWHLELRQPREITEVPEDQLDLNSLQLKRNGLTICGLPSGVVMFLKMAMVLEPMQVLMSQCKTQNDFSPRQALKHVIFLEKTRRDNAARQQLANTAATNSINAAPTQPSVDEAPAKKQPRKRTRKPANENGAPKAAPKRSRGGNNANANNQSGLNSLPPNAQMPPANFPAINPNFNAPYSHEVLTVSEPSMMGNEFGADDERTISRIENAQYDQQNSMIGGGIPVDGIMPNSHGPPSGMIMPSVMNGSCN